MPLAPGQVPSQRPLAPNITLIVSVGIIDLKLDSTYELTDIYLTAEGTPGTLP